eukprot:TRINITY_DN62692_c1_g1_i1.p1 TRINITY_DN62692_c1_g1~~TRINITY_DN62692_c1_g1_i1.p1  ORF type:complete len:453 (+),score=39.61 TRINITY_DN62692_c1_g1_i1:26-1384(+)
MVAMRRLGLTMGPIGVVLILATVSHWRSRCAACDRITTWIPFNKTVPHRGNSSTVKPEAKHQNNHGLTKDLHSMNRTKQTPRDLASTNHNTTQRSNGHSMKQTTKKRNQLKIPAVDWDNPPTFAEFPPPSPKDSNCPVVDERPKTKKKAIMVLASGAYYVQQCATTIASVWYTYNKTLPPNVDLVVLAVGIPPRHYHKFQRFGAKVWPREPIPSTTYPTISRPSWAKVLYWSATEYHKIITLDCDLVVQRPIDTLFSYPAYSAMITTNSEHHPHLNQTTSNWRKKGGDWNSGVQVIRPDKDKFKKIYSALVDMHNADNSSKVFQQWRSWVQGVSYGSEVRDQALFLFLTFIGLLAKPVCSIPWWYNCMVDTWFELRANCPAAGVVHYQGGAKPQLSNLSCSDPVHQVHTPPQSIYQPYCNVRQNIHLDFGDKLDLKHATTPIQADLFKAESH